MNCLSLRFMVAIYVDNFYVTYLNEGESLAFADHFCVEVDARLRACYSKLTDLGSIRSVLGCDYIIAPNGREATLSASRYLGEVADRFGLTESKPRRSPWGAEVKLEAATSLDQCTDFPFRQLLGCLAFAGDRARSDFLVHCSILAKFSNCPTTQL